MQKPVILVIISMLIVLAAIGCSSERDDSDETYLDSGTDSSADVNNAEMDGVEPVCPDGVFHGDYVITNEDDMWRIAECTKITGYLYIDNTKLTNLDGLSKLTSIGGELRIRNNSELVSLQGLRQLKSTGGLDIIQNSSLIDLSGLDNLAEVHGSVVIWGVKDLTPLHNLTAVTSNLDVASGSYDFRGLDKLTSIGGYFNVRPKVVNFNGLENLEVIGGDFYIRNASNLVNFVGLEHLKSIGGNLEIKHNPKLQNFIGLDNLISVGGNVTIGFCYQCDPIVLDKSSNDALTTLDGLETLTSIGGDLVIIGNTGLNNMNALANLATLGGDLFISDNDLLDDIKGLSGLKSANGIYIWRNPLVENYDVLRGVTRHDVQEVDYRYSYLRELNDLCINQNTNYMRYLVDLRLPVNGAEKDIWLVDDHWGSGGIEVLFEAYTKAGEFVKYEWPFDTGIAELPKKKVEIKNARIGVSSQPEEKVLLYGFSEEVEVTFIEERPTDFDNYIQLKSAQWWPE